MPGEELAVAESGGAQAAKACVRPVLLPLDVCCVLFCLWLCVSTLLGTTSVCMCTAVGVPPGEAEVSPPIPES